MASTYLTRTTGTSPTSRQKFTVSFWCKIDLSSANLDPFGIHIDGNTALWMEFNNGTKRLKFIDYSSGTENAKLETNRVFRDCNSFYHIVLSVDSTLATSTDRLKLYINGIQETSFASSIYPSQNHNFVNNVGTTTVGKNYDANYFSGIISHFHWVDGTAYDATAFGETDATTGEWKIKTSPSVTYGTNGFFILKDGNSVTDQSGNGNNFTVGGGNVTNTEDCPSNVFNTMTALAKSTKVDLANGGCTTIGNTTAGSGRCRSNWNIPNYGKWYFEYKMIADNQGNTYPNSGIKYNADIFYSPENSDSQADIYVYGIYSGELIHVNNGTSITAGAPATSGDIFGWSVDMDNGAIYIHRNGTYINSGDPTSGSSKTGAIYSFTPSDYPNMCVVSNEFGNSETQYNFGNGHFGTATVASAGTNASGNGIFEYDVPTGYTALSTKGLNL